MIGLEVMTMENGKLQIGSFCLVVELAQGGSVANMGAKSTPNRLTKMLSSQN